MSSCPSFVENMMYSTGGTTEQIDQDERDRFNVMVSELDEKAEKYDMQRNRKQRIESMYHKKNRLGIHSGVWCTVDTDGVFEYGGHKYRIDPSAEQYHLTNTEFGDLYDMDRILVVDGDLFYDMNYDAVSAKEV